MNYIDQIYKKIVNIEIQGATNVAEAVLQALKKTISDKRIKTSRQLLHKTHKAGYYLSRARDTEPMAENSVRFIEYHLKKNQDLEIRELRKLVSKAIDSFLFNLAKDKKNISELGEGLIQENENIFTHCHSSTVMGILKAAKKKKIHVFNTETRPLFQGRKTSRQLMEAKMKNTQVVDSAGAFFISDYSKGYDMDLLILGCDAVLIDGSALNKIGSFGLALAAYDSDIPVYIATHSLKLDLEAKTVKSAEIEKRSADEVWPNTPKNLKILNFAFDIVPEKFITAYITELGLVKPGQIAKKAKKKYKFLKL
jgi:ribose 1,5-bisphosphate isomerase